MSPREKTNSERINVFFSPEILSELKNTSSMEAGSILPEMLKIYLALFAMQY